MGELVESATVDAPAVAGLWYRGQKDATWGLSPSIRRRGYSPFEERNLAHRFRARAALRMERAPEYRSTPAWLSLMQHHGLPTRLLDWSRSLLVAAFFAVWDPNVSDQDPSPDADAVIWRLNPYELNVQMGLGDHTPAIVSEEVRSMSDEAFWSTGESQRPAVAVMAWEEDSRMVAQQGAFTMHASDRPLDELQNADKWLVKFVVPSSRIVSLRDELQSAGIRLGDLFPDLAHLARDLVATYPPGALSSRPSR